MTTTSGDVWRGIAACVLGAACAVAHAGPALTLHTLEWAPYSWNDGKGAAVGIAVDIVAELLAHAELPVVKTDIIPWARGLALTASTPDTCQLMVGRTPEREAKYQWIGPIGQSNWTLFALREKKIVLNSIDDARPYLVGTIIDDLSIPTLKSKHIRVSEVASDRLNPAKLLRHRIDLWASADLPAQYIMREQGISEMEPVLHFATVQMYLACNKSMKDSEVGKLNRLLKAMMNDKSVERIYTRYGFKNGVPRN